MIDAAPLCPLWPESVAACALSRCFDIPPRLNGPEDVEVHSRAVVTPQRRMFIAETGDAVACRLAVDEGAAEITSVYRAAPGSRVGPAPLAAATSGRRLLSRWTCQADAGARRVHLRDGVSEGDMTLGENDDGLPDIQDHRDRQSEARA